MVTMYNVFEPRDLEFAQTIFDDVWSSVPTDIRGGPRNAEFKEWLAKQVLASINSIRKSDAATSYGLKTQLRDTVLRRTPFTETTRNNSSPPAV